MVSFSVAHQLHCINIFPPVTKDSSALWGVRELPGLCIHRYPSTGPEPGWRVESWVDSEASDMSRKVVETLRDQVFPTRRDALDAVALIMDMT
jgi:hypothetical protein